MEECAEFVWLWATLDLFNAILFRAVRGAILDILNKINRANFFKSLLSKKTQCEISKNLFPEINHGYMPFSQLILYSYIYQGLFRDKI
jgi:hypothetical protein